MTKRNLIPSDAVNRVQMARMALSQAVKAVNEAKERVYDVYNVISDGGLIMVGFDDELLEAIGKRRLNKLGKIENQCYQWASELAEMVEEIEKSI